MRLRILPLAFASALLLWACGDDDVTPPADTAVTDTSTTDTAVTDTLLEDTATTDTATTDTSVADTAVADTSTMDTSTTDTSTTDTSDTMMADVDDDAVTPAGTFAEVVADALLLANDATLTVNTTYEGLTVTVIKPTHGTEVGGFFLQDGEDGAAIHVQVDADPVPAEVTALAPGDVVSIQIGTVTMASGVPMVTAFSDLAETGTEAGFASWPRDLSALDSVDDFAEHLSALVSMTGTLTSGPLAAGGGDFGFRRFTVTTAGLPAGDARLAMRFPVALVDALGLGDGCVVDIEHGALWGFRTGAAEALTDYQPSAYAADDMTVVCPAPEPVSATANDSTVVTVSFNRPLDAATVVAGAFTIDPALAVTDATLGAGGKSVTLKTAEQAAGTTYTITVATSVTDVLGEPVPAASTVTFDGTAPALPIGAVWCFDDSTLNATSSPGVTAATFTWSAGGGSFVQGNRSVGVVPPVGCAGATSDAASNNGWLEAAAPDFATGPYFEVGFTTAAAGTVVIEFDGRRSTTGPAFIQPHYEGASLGSPIEAVDPFTGHPMHATDEATVAAGAHAFRFYGYGATAASGTFRVDNLVVRFVAD